MNWEGRDLILLHSYCFSSLCAECRVIVLFSVVVFVVVALAECVDP